MTILTITACAVFVGVLIVAEAREQAPLKWIAKPAASALFVILAVQSGALETSFGQIVLSGLLFCALGDIFLIVRREAFFLAGMGAFALGHLLYAGAFLSRAPAWSLTTTVTTALMVTTGAIFLRLMWRHLGSFRIPVLAYTVIIGVMVIASATFFRTPPDAAPSLHFMVAALAFAVSDIAVARDQFLAHSLLNKIWGLPLYYGAQLLFASSV